MTIIVLLLHASTRLNDTFDINLDKITIAKKSQMVPIIQTWIFQINANEYETSPWLFPGIIYHISTAKAFLDDILGDGEDRHSAGCKQYISISV